MSVIGGDLDDAGPPQFDTGRLTFGTHRIERWPPIVIRIVRRRPATGSSRWPAVERLGSRFDFVPGLRSFHGIDQNPPERSRCGEESSKMMREPVSSSSLAEVGYHGPTETMEVCFKNGRIYQYFDVPRDVYDELMRAESPGGYLSSEVKGRFRYARV